MQKKTSSKRPVGGLLQVMKDKKHCSGKEVSMEVTLSYILVICHMSVYMGYYDNHPKIILPNAEPRPIPPLDCHKNFTLAMFLHDPAQSPMSRAIASVFCWRCSIPIHHRSAQPLRPGRWGFVWFCAIEICPDVFCLLATEIHGPTINDNW